MISASRWSFLVASCVLNIRRYAAQDVSNQSVCATMPRRICQRPLFNARGATTGAQQQEREERPSMAKRAATTSRDEQAGTRGKKRFLFQPLTCIRQTGITREWDGTTTYSYV